MCDVLRFSPLSAVQRLKEKVGDELELLWEQTPQARDTVELLSSESVLEHT